MIIRQTADTYEIVFIIETTTLSTFLKTEVLVESKMIQTSEDTEFIDINLTNSIQNYKSKYLFTTTCNFVL